jgi:hypothetical protein
MVVDFVVGVHSYTLTMFCTNVERIFQTTRQVELALV